MSSFKTCDFILPYEMLLNIFKFLNYQDLTRAARVNSFWNDVSKDPALWRKFAPRDNIRITDVPLMITNLRNYKMTHLDFKNVILKSTDALQIPKAIEMMKSLKVVELPQCDVKVLEKIFRIQHTMHSLTVVVSPQGKTLNFENIANLSELRKLKISFKSQRFVENLKRLSSLKYLGELNLSNVLANDFSFLKKMNLISLSSHVGYGGMTLANISKMSTLERLCIRMRNDGDVAEMTNTIKQLKRLKQLHLLDGFDFDMSQLPARQPAENFVDLMERTMLDKKRNAASLILDLIPALNLDTFAWGLSNACLPELGLKYIPVTDTFLGSLLHRPPFGLSFCYVPFKDIGRILRRNTPHLKLIFYEQNDWSEPPDFKDF